MFRKVLVGAALAGALLAAGCESYGPTPYGPAAKGAAGYSDVKLEANRYRIAFKGNSLTDKERVETYLLYRAAELTLQNGFDVFTIVHRDTDKRRWRTYQGDYFPDPWAYSYYSPRRGWRRGFYDPPFGPMRIEDATEYEASAEIVLTKGPKGADANAFDAHQVEANLGTTIARPEIH